LTCANLFNVIALDAIGISATYTTKCAIPIMTVIIQAFQNRSSLPNNKAIATLPLIAIGIAMSNWNAPNFDASGFTFAMLSCVAQSMLNVCCKTAMQRTNLRGVDVQRNLVVIGLFLLSVKQCTVDKLIERRQQRQQRQLLQQQHPPSLLTMFMASSYHYEYSLSFAFLSNISSVTFAITDALRRLCIIVNGRIFFGGDDLTRANKAGIIIAVAGALLYALNVG